jgi:Anti-sigma factor NepR
MKNFKPVKPGPKTIVNADTAQESTRSKMNIADPLADGKGTLGRDVQDVIGKQLRNMYDDLVNQAVPDRFTELLQQLDKRDDKGQD